MEGYFYFCINKNFFIFSIFSIYSRSFKFQNLNIIKYPFNNYEQYLVSNFYIDFFYFSDPKTRQVIQRKYKSQMVSINIKILKYLKIIN